MAKRKRIQNDESKAVGNSEPASKKSTKQKSQPTQTSSPAESVVCIQIITGSYDRVLHGLTATVDMSRMEAESNDAGETQDSVSFADTFLFNAHSSSVRCLALSPLTSNSTKPDVPTKLVLASGGADERINLYSISAHALSSVWNKPAVLSSVQLISKLENPKNREIGALLHHASTVTKICFATKSKLISASEDNTIAVSRTRDWTVLTTLKAPIPQAHGRPSGDTAAPGKTPAGVNDFDIDPSMKIMISVGRGERCMRLWNLVTGKKAGALNFDRDLLQALGESKFHSGEGRKVLFQPDGRGFVIGFDKGAVVFDMDSKVQGVILPNPRTKVHQIRFLPGEESQILGLSTEDGRVIFFDVFSTSSSRHTDTSTGYSSFAAVGQFGGASDGVAGRIKDFEILKTRSQKSSFIAVTAGSDGAIRLWSVRMEDMKPVNNQSQSPKPNVTEVNGHKDEVIKAESIKPKSNIGRLIGRFDTANRITCLKAFEMLPPNANIESYDDASNGVRSKYAEMTHGNKVRATKEDSENEFEGFD